MKNIDLIFGYPINSPNGISSVVRLLMENSSCFEETGIICNFHVRGISTISDKNSQKSDPKKVKQSVKSRVKDNIKSIIDATTRIVPHLNSAYKIFNTLMLPGRRIAKNYTNKESSQSTDPLFFNDIFSCYYYLKFTKTKNRPILLVIHSNGETFNMLKMSFPDIEGSWVSKKLSRIEKYTFSKVSKFGFVAKNAMDHFHSLHPDISHSRLHYVHNGLPLIEVAPAKKELPNNSDDNCVKLCCVGSISYRKGQDIIIEALSNLTTEERKRLHVTFVGDGHIRRELENECRKNGLENNVSFVGARNDVDNFLVASDIFILTSRDEGFPMAILEAERAGLPVISTNVAGIPEMIIDGQTGLIIKPDAKQLTDIFKNIRDYNWKEMGAKSRKLFVEKFTISKTIGAYCDIFRNM